MRVIYQPISKAACLTACGKRFSGLCKTEDWQKEKKQKK
jgi:hypothetical protein